MLIPFSTPIWEGFKTHGKLKFHGEAICGPNQGFVIEFYAGNEIAMHMNARFGACGDFKLVMNSNECGYWKCEDRHHNPFKLDHHFHLKIKNHGSHFSIHVNDHHVCHFYHRIDPCRITGLGIKGDVRIFKIHFEHFSHHNGGGIQVGSMPMGMGPMPVAPMPIAPMPIGGGVVPMGGMPIGGVMPPPYIGGGPPMGYGVAPMVVPGPTVIIEEDHHHHRRHHGFLHNLFHHHHHH
uniref:Galectin n=1 Tax=Rhabditophanes sp. KR3021 TaxID=114890 RepID=A0AC35U526_9BILA